MEDARRDAEDGEFMTAVLRTLTAVLDETPPLPGDDCPQLHVLQGFLNGELEPAERDDLVTHLRTGCLACLAGVRRLQRAAARFTYGHVIVVVAGASEAAVLQWAATDDVVKVEEHFECLGYELTVTERGHPRDEGPVKVMVELEPVVAHELEVQLRPLDADQHPLCEEQTHRVGAGRAKVPQFTFGRLRLRAIHSWEITLRRAHPSASCLAPEGDLKDGDGA